MGNEFLLVANWYATAIGQQAMMDGMQIETLRGDLNLCAGTWLGVQHPEEGYSFWDCLTAFSHFNSI